MILTLLIAIHYTIKDHKFVKKNIISIDKIIEKKYINIYVNFLKDLIKHAIDKITQLKNKIPVTMKNACT